MATLQGHENEVSYLATCLGSLTNMFSSKTVRYVWSSDSAGTVLAWHPSTLTCVKTIKNPDYYISTLASVSK